MKLAEVFLAYEFLPYEYTKVLGVYSSQEKAEQRLEKFKRESNYQPHDLELYVGSFEMDDEIG